MKEYKVIAKYTILLAVLTLFITCKKSEKRVQYGEATQELVALMDSNPELKAMLETSIQKAKEINPDKNTNPAHNLTEYYDFINWAEKAMPWTLIKKGEQPKIFDDTFQSLCAFYFLIDQPLPELEGKGLVNNSLQYAEPFASWLVTFTKSWGKFLDSTASWNDEYLRLVEGDPHFGLQNGWYEDPSNWKTFNDFFTRHLKSPDQRPIAVPEYDSIVVSFADSEPQGLWAIDSTSHLVSERGVLVKSTALRSIRALIGEESAYSNHFANGTFTHSFLNVNDYHRYHFPIAGTIKEIRIIPGGNPTGGKLWWDHDIGRYIFNPTAKTGWQQIETRGCVILETENHGYVALLPIGMAAVGSVNFEDTLKVGTKVKKGDMLGYFAFGGSDFILIFQEGVQFTLDAPRQENGEGYQHILMGERLGSLTTMKHGG